ncbi:MAG: rubredoxin [Firmicutes bacterium]|nr:rubredoxin [Bacillota bacterium]
MKKKWKCLVCTSVFKGEEPPIPCPVCSSSKFEEVPIE